MLGWTMSVLVKICGINSLDAADAALRARADYAGLVFHSGSPRNLQPAQARSLADRMRGRIRLVALVADASDGHIEAAMNACKPDYLQLHGSESPDRAAQLRARFNVPVIKAIPVADASDFAAVPAYEQLADMLMFDAKAPANAARPGGHGAAFDWQLLRGRSFSRPWILAGGLNAGNLARAIQSSGARIVDASSGVESAPGAKDPAKIAAFVAAARSAHLTEEARA